MSVFFGELAKQLAGRWLSLLALPGVLFLAAVWIGSRLGQTHAMDLQRLASASTASELAHRSVTVQVLALIGLALASAVVGVVVQALVVPVRALCLGLWPFGLGGMLTSRRRNRWHELVRQRTDLERARPVLERSTEEQRRIDRIAGRINAIAMAEPGRPTWMGDRVHALAEITVNRYGLDLAFGWPRLWLVLDDAVRTEISIAQSAFATAMFTATWSVPYLALGVVWWPAAAIGVGIAAAGWARARRGIATLTDLTEATLDLYGRTLAVALGVADESTTGPLTPDEGRTITDIIRKGR